MWFSEVRISRRYGTDEGFVCGHNPCIFRNEKLTTFVVLLVGRSVGGSPDIGDVLVVVLFVASTLDEWFERFEYEVDGFLVSVSRV